MQIRDMRIGDVELVSNLLIQLTEVMENPHKVSKEDIEYALRDAFDGNSVRVLIAEEDSKIIGAVSFTIRKTLLDKKPSCLVEELSIDTDFRGKGIGKALMEAVVERAQKMSCSEVEVATEKSNINARAFYKSVGFIEEAVLFEKYLDIDTGN